VELPGSSYLYTLATLAMTFAGFCAIVIVLRQTIGKEIAGFHLVLMRLYLESGLWAAAFAMLPPLLVICGVSVAMSCRVSSIFTAIAMLWYGATYVKRRRAMMDEPLPLARWVPIVTISAMVIAALIANAAGIPFSPSTGPIALAASWTLGCGAMVFLLALKAFVGERPSG
jgi:hypothetical protein